MFRFLRAWRSGGSVASLLFLAASTAFADVNLEWRPESTTMDVGGQVRLGLYAVSTTGGDQHILEVEVILGWDPVPVEFLGLVNDGPYAWSSSELPTGPASEGLNDSLTDGDAYYVAFAQFGNPALATPDGLLVASFDFGARLPVSVTTVAIVPSAATHTNTAVWDAETAGNNIVGTLGTALLTIHGCVLDSECSDGNECTQDTCNAGACSNLPVDAACDDGNECTVDTCDTMRGCINDGTGVMERCDDADNCTTEDACRGDAAGTCRGLLTLLFSMPPNGAIDARIAHPIDDANTPLTWRSLTLTFCESPDGVTPEQFTVMQKPAGHAAMPGPAVVSVTPTGGNTAEITLAEPIAAGAWTRITFNGVSTCIGSVPGDADQDGLVDSADIGALIACLNSGACDPWVCDVDRLGDCTGADLTTLVDLLNAAGTFLPPNPVALDPAFCP